MVCGQAGQASRNRPAALKKQAMRASTECTGLRDVTTSTAQATRMKAAK